MDLSYWMSLGITHSTPAPRVLPVAAIERVVRRYVMAFRADTHEKTMTDMGGIEPRAGTSHSEGLTQ